MCKVSPKQRVVGVGHWPTAKVAALRNSVADPPRRASSPSTLLRQGTQPTAGPTLHTPLLIPKKGNSASYKRTSGPLGKAPPFSLPLEGLIQGPLSPNPDSSDSHLTPPKRPDSSTAGSLLPANGKLKIKTKGAKLVSGGNG